MKGLVILALIGCVLALPQRGSDGRRPGRGRPGRQEQQKETDPKVIIRCWAENFGDDVTIKSCIDCFSVEIDFSTQAGLDIAQTCASQYWPAGVAACPAEMAAMVPGDMQTLQAVVQCFDDRLEAANAERCLAESSATELQDKLTDGTMCVLDSWKMAFGAVKNMTGGSRKPRGGRRQGGGGRKGAMKKMMMQTLLEAHCHKASNDDVTKAAECVQCFKDALPSKPTRERNGRGDSRRGRREADPAVLTALAACSRTHLTGAYDECTTLMEDGTDMEAAHQCYSKVLVGNIVGDCVSENEITTAEAGTLGQVVECGVKNVFVWLQEKNPKVAEMMGKFLEKIGGDDDDDDDDDDDAMDA